MLEDGDRKGPRIDGRRDSEEKDRKRWVGERCGDIAHDMLSIDVYYVFFLFWEWFWKRRYKRVYIYILWKCPEFPLYNFILNFYYYSFISLLELMYKKFGYIFVDILITFS